jgi:hypothetical protein
MTDYPDYDLVTDAYESEYDVNYDDFDSVDYLSSDMLEEEQPLDDFFRSFSFHRVNGDDPCEYGGNACD